MYIDVLVTGNVQHALVILKSATDSEKYEMINYPFDYQDEHINVNNKTQKKLKTLYLPFNIAVSSCCGDVAYILMEYGVDVLSVNCNQYNVLHACVVNAFNRPQIGHHICSTVEWFLLQITQNQVRHLIQHENKDGFRPLEFAAQQGCLQLMKSFLQSATYLTKTENCVFTDYQYYDVTEYETGARQSKSPINMLPFLQGLSTNRFNLACHTLPTMCF